MKSALWTTTALALMLSASLAPAYAQVCADGSEVTAEGVCADGSAPAAAAEEAPAAAEEAPAAEAPAAEAPAAAAEEAPANDKAAAKAAKQAARAEKKAAKEAARAEKKAAKAAAKAEKAEETVEPKAVEAAEPKAEETAPVEQAQPEAEPAVEEPKATAESEPKTDKEAAREAKRAERKAARQAERAAKKADGEAASEETDAAKAPDAAEQPSEAIAAPTEAPDAAMTAEDKAAADAAAAKPTVITEEAQPAAIVSDEITQDQRAALKKAERKRRSEARKNRRQLIGAAAAGVAVGIIATKLGGRVVEDQGDRLIVEREDGTYLVRRDENELLRGNGATVRTDQLDENRQRTTVTRPNGVEVVTLRDGYGNILRRTKRLNNGDEIVLIDNQTIDDERVVFVDRLPPLQIGVPEEDYIVSTERADERRLRATLAAAPVEAVERAYSLREIRGSERLRDKVRRIDLDAITFDTGSATVTRSQVALLDGVAQAMNDVLDETPKALFLIEGHTDAVGGDLPNLALSDRRAETIARILIDVYKVPAENLIVEGYGEQNLKVNTESASRENRRVTVRNITSLMAG